MFTRDIVAAIFRLALFLLAGFTAYFWINGLVTFQRLYGAMTKGTEVNVAEAAMGQFLGLSCFVLPAVLTAIWFLAWGCYWLEFPRRLNRSQDEV